MTTVATRAAADHRQTSGPAAVVPARRAGRVVAVLASSCVVVHVPVLMQHMGSYPGASVLMLVLTMACIPCIAHLWKGPRVRDWVATTGIAATMLVVHLSMLGAMDPESSGMTSDMATMVGHHPPAQELPSTSLGIEGLGHHLMAVANSLAAAQLVVAATTLSVVVICTRLRGRGASR